MLPSLRDAGDPEAMFWHFASPALLKRPPGIPDWEPTGSPDWTMPDFLVEPAEVLKRRVETSADLTALITLSDQLGRQLSLSLSPFMSRFSPHLCSLFSSRRALWPNAKLSPLSCLVSRLIYALYSPHHDELSGPMLKSNKSQQN